MKQFAAHKQNYENEIFVSYRRSDDLWVRWTKENFVRALSSLLCPGMGRVRIYIDESIETGADWPHHLALNLSRSKVMIAVLSRDYFMSNWCRLELALMRRREELTCLRTARNPGGLIIPVVIDDGNCFPDEVKRMQSASIHKFANPLMRSDSPRQEDFAEAIKLTVCPAIEQALQNAPDFDPAWEDIAHEQFEDAFRTQTRFQGSVPPLSLPALTCAELLLSIHT
jgi:hypothetical protein